MDTIKDFKDLNEFVPILIFLLPGFLTSKILDILVIRKERDVFDKLVQALVFTFANLALFVVARWIIESATSAKFDRQFLSVGNVLLITSCAVGIGLACAFEIRNELALSFLHKLKFTKKTYNLSTWIDTFSASEKYVVVHLEDGRRIYGWPKFYSDEPGERAIFLQDATWLDEQNKALNEPLISILLDEKSGIQFVEFVSES
jgi:hypothetical protein